MTAAKPTEFTATIAGPSYMVAVVCENTSPGMSFQTWIAGRTLDEAGELHAPCVPSPGRFRVTGHMVPPGLVQLGADANTAGANGDFTLLAEVGTHDLIATSTTRIEILRGLSITPGKESPIQNLDLEHDMNSADLAAVELSVNNPQEGEAFESSVDLTTPTTATGSPIYHGDFTATRIALDAVLLPGDTQTVALVGVTGANQRSIQRPFRLASHPPTAFTLPELILGGEWSIDEDLLTAHWTRLPEADAVIVDVTGASSEEGKLATQEIDLSKGFMAAEGTAEIAVDTEIPGFQPAWRVDLSRRHTRTLRAEHTVDAERATSTFVETSQGGAPPSVR
ncbi:MAG TPA: hypothetical protein VFK02_31205 [Kofleriaceae bacterium]|nr:hypothetical protein [Kofleriaceae bacterium]